MPPKKPAADTADPPALPPSDSPVTETAEKKADAVSLRKTAPHPSTMIMIKEALKELDSRNGVSSYAIQNYIKQKYPTVDVIRLKYLVARAIKRGLENGTLVRPAKSSEAAGLTGKFRLSPKTRQKVKTENADPDMAESSKPAKDEAKKPKKAGVKKKDSKEQTESQEDSKSPKKSKAEEAATSKSAPRKKPKAKTNAEKDGEEASVSSKSKPAKATKATKVGRSAAAPKTGKKTA